ncbi:hypothetical protein [Paracoccus sediminilitoris]|uniref:hypothetical protein n=1 Tax=Paracoccus sediminilitoris TaxID=2202419 RepID=UPI00272B4300|nr:hypothetical protein [Paracoccus sediminilitoris]
MTIKTIILNEINVRLGQWFYRSRILINRGASVPILGFAASVALVDDSAEGIMFVNLGECVSPKVVSENGRGRHGPSP